MTKAKGLIALCKLEYNPPGGGGSRVVLVGQDIPSDFPADDIDSMVEWGSIGQTDDLLAAKAIEAAEQRAVIARAAAEHADAELAALTFKYASDSGSSAEGAGL